MITKKNEQAYRETMNTETKEQIIDRIKKNHEYTQLRFKEIAREVEMQQQEFLEILNKIDDLGIDRIDKDQLIDFEILVRKNYDNLITIFRKQENISSEYSVFRMLM